MAPRWLIVLRCSIIVAGTVVGLGMTIASGIVHSQTINDVGAYVMGGGWAVGLLLTLGD